MALSVSRIMLSVGLASWSLAWFALPPTQVPQQPGAFFDTYCLECHGMANPPAGVSLSVGTRFEDLAKNQALAQRIRNAVASGFMPPSGSPQPKPVEKQALLDGLDKILGAGKAATGVSIRRLNRDEYNNTIRDLTGLDLHPADDFPADDVGYGFDNIADVLSISPLLLEKYVNAAMTVAEAAIPIHESKIFNFQGSEFGTVQNTVVDQDDSRVFFANARAYFTFKPSGPGQYNLRVFACGDQAGPAPCRMSIWIGEDRIDSVEVPSPRDKPALYQFPLDLGNQPVLIGISFDNDFYEPNNPDPRKRDRNLVVHRLQVVGPIGAGSEHTESYRRLIPEQPTAQNKRAVTRRVIARLLLKTFRHPPTDEETNRFAQLATDIEAKTGSWDRGIQTAFAGMLCHPKFLFRLELDGVPGTLTPYDLASRLSYFLWCSTPDEALLARAADGTLGSREELERQVDRMLADPKAERFMRSFVGQWLQLRKLEGLAPSNQAFPEFNEALRASMIRETQLDFARVVKQDLPITEFLAGRKSMINGPLAALYGIEGVTGSEFREVEMPQERAGILSQASFLTVTSNPTRTSPVKRGKFVLENILGTPPPPPPPGAGSLSESPQVIASAPIRERMDAHRKNPMCASCHVEMDSIGYSLENFDGIGRWRTKDGPFPVDARGVMSSGTKFVGPEGLRKILMDRKSDFARCLTEKMMTFATGRGPIPVDQAATKQIVQDLAKNQDRFSRIVRGIVLSEPFRTRLKKESP